MSQKITCPSCKTEIDLEKINQDKYRENLEAEYEKKLEKETEEMRKKAQIFAEQKMQEQAKKDAVEMQDLKNRLEEEAKKSEALQKGELELRKQKRELEDKTKQIELENARKLDEEKQKLEEKITKELTESKEQSIKKQIAEVQKMKDEEFRKKELEFLKQNDQLKRSLDDAKRKAEQGSQQIQGDIQEEDLKALLKQAFPIDIIDDVPTGIKGADLIQTVHDSFGQKSGIIVWESKNTKSWTDSWIPKLKDDKLKVSGNIAILVTTVLPKNIENFGMLDDVMICLPQYAVSVCEILRDKLLSISKVEKSLDGKDMKMEMLYKYLGSEEFGSKVSTMIDVFSKLKADIEVERRAMEKIWSRREKELSRAYMATSMLSGDLEGLMGQALPGAERLELDSGEE